MAIAEWQRIQCGLATLELALQIGNPRLMPQSPVKVAGFKTAIDSIECLAAKVTHSIGSNGYTSSIKLETRTEETEAEREKQTDPDEGITGVIAQWRDQVSKKTRDVLAGSRGNVKELKHAYASKQSAIPGGEAGMGEKYRSGGKLLKKTGKLTGLTDHF
ncbi:hypothetical protein QN360_01080 [Glaciimonas sp. CA11.2]|uniref:hypothetical protein n=1 Tax=Glaciimonas sp. CA11.2 TaxID=3048601 RepID=UPI002AB32AF6|nr:hypothetical protein [Glaciimonas sp. CA11.2]MDY7549179.1 hypothetical protein [Glaciimonas sp. CA11.2]MEB0161500.1 hypothetical protein [Glaciimonas sp. CA11.2]